MLNILFFHVELQHHVIKETSLTLFEIFSKRFREINEQKCIYWNQHSWSLIKNLTQLGPHEVFKLKLKTNKTGPIAVHENKRKQRNVLKHIVGDLYFISVTSTQSILNQ